MSAEDVCPPLYVPTRSECNAAKEKSKEFLLAAGLSPLKWQLDAMGCSCGSHIEDVATAAERTSRHCTTEMTTDNRRVSDNEAQAASEPSHLPVQSLSGDALDAGIQTLFQGVDASLESFDGLRRCAEHFDDLIQARAAAVLRLKFEEVDVLLKFPADVSHESSPSVSAQFCALCDNSNPTDGESPDQEALARSGGDEVGVVVVTLVPDVGEFDTSGLTDGLVEEAGKPVIELRVHVGFVDERQLCCRRDPEYGVSGFTAITSTATPEEHAAALSKRLENAVLQRPDDAVVAVQNHVAASEPIHKSSHNSSPSVGAPSGAVCDNPNPTDGELNPGAVSFPSGAAPAPTQAQVQE